MWINYVNKYLDDDVYLRLLCVQMLKDNNYANQLPSLVYDDMKMYWSIIYKSRDFSILNLQMLGALIFSVTI